MTRLTIFLAALLLMQFAFGQDQSTPNHRYATKKEQQIHEANNDCTKHSAKPLVERLKNYPFNQAVQIQLVSFKSSFDSTLKEYYKDSLPRMGDSICYSKLFEVQKLMYAQIDTLTDLLYNYGYGKQLKEDNEIIYIGSMLLCYNPRNAILFLDSMGKAFEFIEICFECEKTKESSDKISLGEMCNQKLELLKNFFKTVGITYGITQDIAVGN